MPRGGSGRAQPLSRHVLGIAAPLAAGFAEAAASAQHPGPAQQPPQADQAQGEVPEIVVRGERRSAITNMAPLAIFDADAVAATGAASMDEFLRAIRGVTRSADGSEPIFLLNAQRVSGYQEIGALPPEAIEKVEVLPEQAALKFGYPPTRRVLNFITKRRFQQTELSAAAGTTTRSSSTTQKATLGMTRLHDDGRRTLSLEYRRTDRLLQSQRDVLPDPDILFDGIGNVTGANGGEIDPAFSAIAGKAANVAAVPLSPADRSLAGFAAGADRPRLFDLGPYRTLGPRNDTFKAEAVIADRIGKSLAGSISLSAEQSRDRTLAGPASAILPVPASNPYSPFDRPVLLHRYLIEAATLRQHQTTTTLHGGITLRRVIAGWRWDFTASLDQLQVRGRSERDVDLAAAEAAIAGGANPFAPLDASLLQARLVDRARLLNRTTGAKSVLANTPIHLPAGEVTVTATVEAERATAVSYTRGPNPFDLRLGRTRTEGGIAVDVPIASRRLGVLPFLGQLSVSASANARHVSGFGSLSDTTYGFAWAPIDGVQWLGTVKLSEAPPPLKLQSTPVVRVTNAQLFDYGTGRTELATLILGGNPDLLAEKRRVSSLGLTLKPFSKREWRVSATYEAVTIRNQTAIVYALTPQTEAIFPDLFTRDAAGRLVSVAFRPINFHRERQRTLNLNVNAWGMLGKPPPAGTAKPPQRPTYYAGIGPTIKFSDRLQLRPTTPELDILNGDTVTGAGTARAFGYAYGGINYLGNGLTFDAWYGGASRVRSANPAADLHFSPIFRLNVGGSLSIHHFLPHEDWTRHLQLKLDVNNVGDAHQHVRDGNGRVPNRFQPDLLDPIGRTVSLTLRKQF
jgi:hypothetical protein